MLNILYEFHVSKTSRDKYKFDQSLFETNGNMIIGNFHSARLLASKINAVRDIIHYPDQTAKASEIYALGLIDELFHYLFRQLRLQSGSDLFSRILESLENDLSEKEINEVIDSFLLYFPPKAVYKDGLDINEYIISLKNSQQYALAVEEIILLWVENQNPALANYKELLSDEKLSQSTPYSNFMQSIYKFFSKEEFKVLDQPNFIDLLLAPARAVPNSILGQLEFIRNRWGSLLGDLIYRLLGGLDFLQEEEKIAFQGPGPALVPNYNQNWDRDQEKFSPDREWMPSLVLLAKNAFVWLDQLSKKYQRPIDRLDLIPDEELDTLQERGFSGLWLIGIWERSDASATIKKLCGNPEALASAYSLAGYQIAQQLGGEGSYQNLRQRTWLRGIRLASDMVPNHMGIDSNWVYEHPNWFIGLDYSPFPSYSYNGPDLSSKPDIEIKIEDHYFDRTDAAVVFQYRNKSSAETKYIYHGNDGTTMPWNDTAQLNYLLPEVREAVYQTILSVARQFPIIRFDAAMTLAKKHYQRLWFPEPGSGGAIPSRAEYGLTKEQFDNIMPDEFWRVVVDRLAIDAPDTLLLAEAFWLMESYFVRTLGMHRVYNSAFMHMLRNEDNANYRRLIKNTLEFDPQILKRFVNFMNNPDEKTAAEQFGKGDKYFGICTIMSTLPGLPMFGHGQIEGYSEKYGMEFKRANWDEHDDVALIQRHKQQIFPLLHRRRIFSEVENFHFFDFFDEFENINEDVFVYSNYVEGQGSLVIYHNKFAETKGWVNHFSQGLENPPAKNNNLFSLLFLNPAADFITFKDVSSNLEFIRSRQEYEEKGLYFQLHAYQTHVFIDFRPIFDDEWNTYQKLHEELQGTGVSSIEDAHKELLLKPVLKPIREILNRGFFDYLLENKADNLKTHLMPEVLIETFQKSENLLQGIFKLTGHIERKELILDRINQRIKAALLLPGFETIFPNPNSKAYINFLTDITEKLQDNLVYWVSLISYIFLGNIGQLVAIESDNIQTLGWFSEWRLSKILNELGNQYGFDFKQNEEIVTTINTLTSIEDWYSAYSQKDFQSFIHQMVINPEVQNYILVNRFKESLWFNKEKFELLVFWLLTIQTINLAADPKISATIFIEKILKLVQFKQLMLQASINSEFKLENLMFPK